MSGELQDRDKYHLTLYKGTQRADTVTTFHLADGSQYLGQVQVLKTIDISSHAHHTHRPLILVEALISSDITVLLTDITPRLVVVLCDPPLSSLSLDTQQIN